MNTVKEYNHSLFEFIDSSPTAFHVVMNMKEQLLQNGFLSLDERDSWNLQAGHRYFVERDQGSIIAFCLGEQAELADGFRMLGAHTDSPSLQLKPHALLRSNGLSRLAVEVYGGPILSSWFDRQLSLAGRVFLRQASGELRSLLLDFKRPLLTIPHLAIHLDREVNKGRAINAQTELTPLFSQEIDRQLPDFYELLQDQVKLQYPEYTEFELLSYDLFCYDLQQAYSFGLENEFISASRLDNQLSCYAGLQALLQCDKAHNSMLFCFNHEENGSVSSSGGDSSYPQAVLERILPNVEERYRSYANSLLISMDNAHATHPNFAAKSDSGHPVELNKGPVIKINANQRYATNSRTAGCYKSIAAQAGISCQEFVMRSDMPCGSTIGPMFAARFGIDTVDVGAASFGMHSIRETTGVLDPQDLFHVVREFLDCDANLIS